MQIRPDQKALRVVSAASSDGPIRKDHGVTGTDPNPLSVKYFIERTHRAGREISVFRWRRCPEGVQVILAVENSLFELGRENLS